MKYIDEYRNKEHITKLVNLIRGSGVRDYSFMEVCGGHTAAIQRFGIPFLLPENIRLISGPGCPVCVTGVDYIDKAICYARMDNVIIATFGDLLRVPGSASSLEKEKAAGADIQIVFSALDALDIARANHGKTVIFLGIGFETTAPGTAVTLIQADLGHVDNMLFLTAHKVMPPAIDAIIRGGAALDGFICPGHVSAITGSSVFNFVAEKYNLGCVIAGFEPLDILMSILMLIRQANTEIRKVEIQYRRAVSVDGNSIARKKLYGVFEPCDAIWRGFGIIPGSGLRLRKEFEKFDAEFRIPVKVNQYEDNDLCICGKILRGLLSPPDCPLFSDICSPENPVGACMVSNEGACNSWHKYRNVR
jgi:hydrogenase expression/formation protein HypD